METVLTSRALFLFLLAATVPGKCNPELDRTTNIIIGLSLVVGVLLAFIIIAGTTVLIILLRADEFNVNIRDNDDEQDEDIEMINTIESYDPSLETTDFTIDSTERIYDVCQPIKTNSQITTDVVIHGATNNNYEELINKPVITITEVMAEPYLCPMSVMSLPKDLEANKEQNRVREMDEIDHY